MIAVNVGRSWKATEIGSRKKTGSSAAVAPPDARHSVMIHQVHGRRRPIPHRGTGPFSTATNHNSAATAYTPRITAYNPGSQWSTSQIHTSTPIRPIIGSRRIAETRIGSAAK